MVTSVPMGCERGLTLRTRFPRVYMNQNLLRQLTSAFAWDTEGYPRAAFLRVTYQTLLTKTKNGRLK